MVKQLPSATSCRLSLEQMTSRLAIMMAAVSAEELVSAAKGYIGSLVRYRAGDQAGADDGDALGLSEALGTVSYGENQARFSRMSVSRTQNASERPVQKIDTGFGVLSKKYNEATRI